MNINEAFSLLIGKLQGWLNTLIAMLPNLLIALLVVVAFYVLARVVGKLTGKLLGRFSSHTAVNRLIVNTLVFLILIIGLFFALGVLNLDKTVTSLLAGAGIIGLALGFAFQDIASNFMAGIILAVRQPFRIGDIISSGDYFGTVEQISLRTTNLLVPEGQIVLIPNQMVFQNPIVNYTRTRKRRIDLGVGVSYGDDLDKVKQVTLDAVGSLDYIDKEREIEVFFKEFGDSSINFDVRFWIDFSKQKEYLRARSDAVMQIKAAFDANDITIPFPIRTLDFGIKGGEKLSQMPLDIRNGSGEEPDR